MFIFDCTYCTVYMCVCVIEHDRISLYTYSIGEFEGVCVVDECQVLAFVVVTVDINIVIINELL